MANTSKGGRKLLSTIAREIVTPRSIFELAWFDDW
jgi:hypothetical protein